MTELLDTFWGRSGLPPTARLPDVVDAIRSIPYGRPRDPSPEGVVRDWRGTCSTKHLLLASLVAERWPDADPKIVHLIYRVTPEFAAARWPGAAPSVPPGGLIDVHTYATVRAHGRRIRIDVTFPGAPWTGTRTCRSRAAKAGTGTRAPIPSRARPRSFATTAIRPSGSRSSPRSMTRLRQVGEALPGGRDQRGHVPLGMGVLGHELVGRPDLREGERLRQRGVDLAVDDHLVEGQ